MTHYTLEKSLWTDADFERMGWHDSYIHAIAFRPDSYELLFDIDYAFKWQDPGEGEVYYKFWLSPCTLTFRGVSQVAFSLQDIEGISIADVSRSRPETHASPDEAFRYRIECIEGEISLIAAAYTQFARRPPVLTSEQVFTLQERGGISFDTPPLPDDI